VVTSYTDGSLAYVPSHCYVFKIKDSVDLLVDSGAGTSGSAEEL
jgi:hypothetical protein